MTFYHGSASRLGPGDILVPGAEVGVSFYNRSEHVYMTQGEFSLTEADYVPPGVYTSEQYALRSALLWACWAADVACDGECDWDMDHSQSVESAMVPECVHVYTVQPLGPVWEDDAQDSGVDACRTTHAQIVTVLDDDAIARLLEW